MAATSAPCCLRDIYLQVCFSYISFSMLVGRCIAPMRKCHAMPGFVPVNPYIGESVALLVARRTNNRKVVGSRPAEVVCITVLT